MAISSFLKQCEYRLGGLRPFVYLIPQDRMKIKYKAKGINVSVSNVTKNESKIYKIDARLVTYSQEEDYNGKFSFANTVEITVEELYNEPFFYALNTLRTNKYYIVIEDNHGVQYLTNCELNTVLTYEYTFTDAKDMNNTLILTYSNTSNSPLLIFDNNVSEDEVLMEDNCEYNIGRSLQMKMGLAKNIATKDDNIKVDKVYLNETNDLKDVQWLPESFNFTESYDGKNFTVKLQFSINLSDYKYYWEYDLLEFPDNTYKALIYTSNNNMIVAGNQYGLFPSYTIETSESVEEPNVVTFTMSTISQYPSLYSEWKKTTFRWIDEGERQCFGYDLYSILKQQVSYDNGEHWEDVKPELKKKGELIEGMSYTCGYRVQEQWKKVPAASMPPFCINIEDNYIRMVEVPNDFICQLGNKYQKFEIETSDDEETWVKTGEYVTGSLISSSDNECSFLIGRWDCGRYSAYYLPINDEYTKWETSDETVCMGMSTYILSREMVSIDNVTFFPSGEYQIVEEVESWDNDCADFTKWELAEVFCKGEDKYGWEKKYYYNKDGKFYNDEKREILIETDSRDCGAGIIDEEWRFVEYFLDYGTTITMYKKEQRYVIYKDELGTWYPLNEYRNVEVEYTEDWRNQEDYVWDESAYSIIHIDDLWLIPNEDPTTSVKTTLYRYTEDATAYDWRNQEDYHWDNDDSIIKHTEVLWVSLEDNPSVVFNTTLTRTVEDAYVEDWRNQEDYYLNVDSIEHTEVMWAKLASNPSITFNTHRTRTVSDEDTQYWVSNNDYVWNEDIELITHTENIWIKLNSNENIKFKTDINKTVEDETEFKWVKSSYQSDTRWWDFENSGYYYDIYYNYYAYTVDGNHSVNTGKSKTEKSSIYHLNDNEMLVTQYGYYRSGSTPYKVNCTYRKYNLSSGRYDSYSFSFPFGTIVKKSDYTYNICTGGPTDYGLGTSYSLPFTTDICVYGCDSLKEHFRSKGYLH